MAQAFEPAGPGDFPVPRSLVHRTGKRGVTHAGKPLSVMLAPLVILVKVGSTFTLATAQRFGWARSQSTIRLENSGDNAGTWLPPLIVQSSTAPPGGELA